MISVCVWTYMLGHHEPQEDGGNSMETIDPQATITYGTIALMYGSKAMNAYEEIALPSERPLQKI